MKNINRIQAKIDNIQNQINNIRISEIIENRIGGKTIIRTGQTNKEFQQRRLELLQWTLNASEEEILDKINQMEIDIPELPLIIGKYTGNDFKTLETVSMYELLLLSIKE